MGCKFEAASDHQLGLNCRLAKYDTTLIPSLRFASPGPSKFGMKTLQRPFLAAVNVYRYGTGTCSASAFSCQRGGQKREQESRKGENHLTILNHTETQTDTHTQSVRLVPNHPKRKARSVGYIWTMSWWLANSNSATPCTVQQW